MSLLIVSAVKFEAQPTLDVCENLQIPYEYFEFGIGPLNGALAVQRLRVSADNRHVLYVGSAGTFAEFQEPYLVQADQVWWMPTAERLALAKVWPELHPPVSLDISEELPLPARVVLTSTSVSWQNAIGTTGLPNRDQLLENMEMYPIIAGLKPVAKRILSIIGVTNAVGPLGSVQWQQNYQAVAQETAQFVLQHPHCFSS